MRPRKCRTVRSSPSARFYKPRGVPVRDLAIVPLKDEEWEAIQLVDYQGLDQAAAAEQMEISRPTFSRVLAAARAAVAKALAEGCALQIGGGDFRLIEADEPEQASEVQNMKVAFTTEGDDMNAALDKRLGRAPKILFYDTEARTFSVIVNPGVDSPHGAGIKAAEAIHKAGATALVTGDVGPKAFAVLKPAGIKAYACEAATVNEALEAFLSGHLREIAGA